MYLRHKKALILRTIAEEWSKERSGSDTIEDILSELLQAFWLGRLTNLRPFPDQPEFTRERALRPLVSDDAQNPHPGILICQSEEDIEAMIVQHEDGSIDVDTRAPLLLPADRRKWSKRIRAEAWETLSRLQASAYSVDFLAGFGMLHIDKLDFLDFIRGRSLEPPSFWFDPDDPQHGIPRTRAKKCDQTGPVAAGKRGRRVVYDYAAIDDVLDTLRRKKGRSAFNDQVALHQHVQDELGESNVPRRTAFHDHLKEYVARNFES